MLLTSACEHGRSNALYVSGGGGDRSNLPLSLILSSVLQMTNF